VKPIYAHETGEGDGIFLAGPSPRKSDDLDWRPLALDILSQGGFCGEVYVPLPRNGVWLDNYDAQIDWEVEYLNKARIIAFWIPRHIENLPGFTTNVEFGEFLHSGKIVFGYPSGADKMKYLHYRALKSGLPVFDDLGAMLVFAQNLHVARAWLSR